MTINLDLNPEPDSGTRRRPWLAGVAAAMLVAAAGGAGFGLGYAVGNDRDQVVDPGATTDESAADESAPAGDDPVTTDAADPAPPTLAEPDRGDPDQGTDAPADRGVVEVVEQPIPVSDFPVTYGPDPWAVQELVYERVVAGGLTLRLQLGESWEGLSEPYVVGGWSTPGWCQPNGLLRVSLGGPGVVDVTSVERYGELFDVGMASMQFLGGPDGAPHRVVVLSLAPDVEAATVTFDDGATDTAAAVGGLAALAVPGFGPDAGSPEDFPYPTYWTQGYTVELAVGGETIIKRHDELGSWDNAEFRASCQPPPPSLPPAGEQPADPAAAEDEIRAAMATLYGGEAQSDPEVELLDDSTGVAEAREQVRESGFETEAASAEAIIEELVFTTPTEAWFRYRIETAGLDLDGRYGVAVVVDGTWRITRDTICQDLSMAGGDCGNWQPIELPSG